jgi:ribosomal protein S18 acetylase RimI-like enzyme
MEITLRKARLEDLNKVAWVESLSTPNLRYVPYVWDMFINDAEGDWSVEEIDGEIVACGKYSILPDGSAWLETLRVIPRRQGLGLGKRLYDHWLQLSEKKGVKTIRMYTGVNNIISKGLAERYGLNLAKTFSGTLMECKPIKLDVVPGFHRITDVQKVVEILIPLSIRWGGWMVMNRTFYTWSTELCAWITEKGMVYQDEETESVIVMGARFMEDKQLHIGLFAGDSRRCLEFAQVHGQAKGVKSIHCLFPINNEEIEKALLRHGFMMESAPFIVMEINL